MNNQTKTGYPSVDKPWLKYYSEEAINAPLPKMTMYQYIWENNKDYLSDVAFRYFGCRITYRKLFEQIRKVAQAFYSVGVRAGDIVTIMSMHTPETIISIYALNYIGAVANMVYMTLSEPEIIETLYNTDSKALLVLDTALDKVRKIKEEITMPVIVLPVSGYMPLLLRSAYSLKNHQSQSDFISFNDFLKGRNDSSDVVMASDHSAPAIIVYTSGTTGDPKGAVLTNDNANSVAFQLLYSGKNYHRRETALFILPPFFGFGIGMLHLSLSVGLESILWIELSVDKIVHAFSRTKPNRIAFGPSLVEPIMEHIQGDMSYMIEFTGGGAAIPAEREERFNTFLSQHGSSAKYTTGYGMTEFASVVCLQTNQVYKFQSIGIPLPKVNVKIVDTEKGNELKCGEIGELCFSAPNAMLGYYKNEQTTNEIVEVDTNGVEWLHTGDLGYCDNDGFLFFCGRIKRIFAVRDKSGILYKIFPQRIEEFLESHPLVDTCAVVVKEDKQRLHIPIAYVSLYDSKVGREKAVQILREAVEKELPSHSWPKEIYVLDSIPVTSNGKIDYRALELGVE